jgi:acetoacetyl-CoA synthetase
MARFMAYAHRGVSDYAALYDWLVRDPEAFWSALWRFCGVKTARGWDRVLEHGGRLPGARWFPGARLNFAENLLRRRDDHPALIGLREDGARRVLSYRALHGQVSRLAQALSALGIGPGDRVAGYLPNTPEAVIAMLASTSLR